MQEIMKPVYINSQASIGGSLLKEQVFLYHLGLMTQPCRKTSRGTDISNLIVEIFNGGKTSDLRKGSSNPLTAPLIATNFNL